MATTYNHVQIGVVDKAGNVSVLYPVNTAEDVSVDRSKNKSVPSAVSNLQDIVNSFKDMAFNDGSTLVYLENADEYAGQQPGTEINDDETSFASTWSSKKLNSHVERFIPTKDLVLTDVSALPLTATKFVVNGKDSNFAGLCPAAGKYWFVDYIPIVTSVSQIAGYPGGTNTVSFARQVWVGHAMTNPSEGFEAYERIYMNGAWGAFNKITSASLV